MLRGFLLLLNLTGALRLVVKLMLDRRVPLGLKMLFPAALIYIVLPFDLMPDYIPIRGQIDDLLALVLATGLFLGLAPKNIVMEHRGRSPTNEAGDSSGRGSVIEGDYRVIDDEN